MKFFLIHLLLLLLLEEDILFGYSFIRVANCFRVYKSYLLVILYQFKYRFSLLSYCYNFFGLYLVQVFYVQLLLFLTIQRAVSYLPNSFFLLMPALAYQERLLFHFVPVKKIPEDTSYAPGQIYHLTQAIRLPPLSFETHQITRFCPRDQSLIVLRILLRIFLKKVLHTDCYGEISRNHLLQ